MRRTLAAMFLLALSASGCGGGFGEGEACRMVKDLIKQEAGYELHDAYRVPAVAYRNVEVLECFEFESDSDRGWARIKVRARGDEYEVAGQKLLGRTDFSPVFEFDRYDQGWKIVR